MRIGAGVATALLAGVAALRADMPMEATAQLLQLLLLQPPSATIVDDPWAQKFDALLKAPENISLAERVNAVAKAQGFFSFERHFLYVGPFLDAAGVSHTLVVEDYPVTFIPGNGRAAYYVFDGNGFLVQAGVFDTGHRIYNLSGSVNDERTELVLRGQFIGGGQESTYDQIYRLGGKGLALHSLHDAHGVLNPNDSMWQNFGGVLYPPPERNP